MRTQIKGTKLKPLGQRPRYPNTEQTCPLLLRVFTTNSGRHHRVDEFARGNVPSSELQIYTWMDATLKELTSLVKEVYPEARKKGTYFSFAIVIVFAFICGSNLFCGGRKHTGNGNYMLSASFLAASPN
uniref:18 kDa Sin3-associated polypeptide n=1 Tax=Neolamprologus brichardi TaxID=32507 RepID=A0A3Q4I2Z1_NEOBR